MLFDTEAFNHIVSLHCEVEQIVDECDKVYRTVHL